MRRPINPITGKIRNANPKPQDLREVDRGRMKWAEQYNGDEPVRIETAYRLFGSLGDGNRWVGPHRAGVDG